MSHPGIYVRGATTALTRRTTMRKAFLAPWHPMVEQLALWFLAKAQVKTGVAIHASHFVINHHHTTVTPSDPDGLPQFMRIFHGELSCALNTLLAHEKYDAPGEIFDDRNPHRMRLLDPAAQLSHHVYECLNTQSAGLVARPEHMPGLALNHRHWRGGPLVINRPDIYVDGRRSPAQLPLFITPQPETYRTFDGDLDALVHHIDRSVDHGHARVRDARRKHRAPVGAKEVQRIHPWSEPKTLRETRGRRVPTYKVGARGIVGQLIERTAAGETTMFHGDHRDTRIARRDGNSERAYPFGTYKARVHEGAPVQGQPPPHAIVARPGATLEEVKADLAKRREEAEACEAKAGPSKARIELIDEVRAAFEEEAAQIVSHDDIELARRPQPAEENPDLDAKDEPHGVEVRRRSGSRSSSRSKPRRIVTLRDRRRGRPKREPTTHGSDPPE